MSLSASSAHSCDCSPSILVVDDIYFNMMAVRLMIEDKFSMGVSEALDGNIAVDMFKAGLDKPCGCPDRAFKLIFMDMSMPIMGGLEASQAIFKMVEAFPEVETTIVILTAFTNEKLFQDCKELGIKKCIGKPLKYEALHECMHRYLYGVDLEEYKILFKDKFDKEY